jgi:hypothetical protein
MIWASVQVVPEGYYQDLGAITVNGKPCLEPAGRCAPTYPHALLKQRAAPDLPYTMEVWYLDKKIMNVQWDDDDKIQLISFHVGSWEEKLAIISKTE